MSTSKQVVLTGITPSGTPHIGNYIGAIKPALELAKNPDYKARYFIADYHSLIKLWDADLRKQYTYEIAATWLALGLDPKQVVFYRQSDVPEIMELTWILTTMAAKGLLNRAHAYKAQVDANLEEGVDTDSGITMGLFNYPVLMAADILMFNTELVPVGKDQIQHVEIARDIAARFNHVYKTDLLTPPKALVDDKTQTIPGLDGRKMSKSYGNTIPIFAPEKKLRKLIMKIKTNSLLPEEPKVTRGCALFTLYQCFANEAELNEMKLRYQTGIGWGEVKQTLFEKINADLKAPRDKYNELMANHDKIESLLKHGAEQARMIALPLLNKVRKKIGI
jgi:tryptophanyl-tRNA synthetase